jgi:bacillithiol system protein YtxJ
MTIERVETIEEFKKILLLEDNLMFLKNSATCPISAEAFRVFTKGADELHAIWYYLDVQDSRELSNNVAELFEVKHASPQVIKFYKGEVIWHDSHWNITLEKLKKIWTDERKTPEV